MRHLVAARNAGSTQNVSFSYYHKKIVFEAREDGCLSHTVTEALNKGTKE